MTPTAEQLAIIDAAQNTTDNLIISAYAGAAKTSTLVLIAKALPSVPIFCIAFNKKISEEMTKRLPTNCTAKTLNAIGHQAWSAAIGKRLTLDTDKIHKIIKTIPDFPWDKFGDISTAVTMARANGYIPEGNTGGKSLISAESFFDNLEDAVPEDIVDQILNESIRQAWTGLIDFNDQLYMPTLFSGVFPKPQLLMIDEAQDLSPLNHRMLDRMVQKRIIAVGDPNQAIYGFRGADQDSMDHLEIQFNMRKLKLSTTFRCARSITQRAKWRAPDISCPDTAAEGSVTHLQELHISEILPGAAVICRKNAPLIRLAFQLIRAGRGPKFIGFDIGPQLVRVLRKLGPSSTPQAEALTLLAKWNTGRKQSKTQQERYECLKLIINEATDLGFAIMRAEQMFSADGQVLLMSGHKSKGLEFDTVYHLDPTKYGPGPQEANIRYVIETRAKTALYLIEAENVIV